MEGQSAIVAFNLADSVVLTWGVDVNGGQVEGDRNFWQLIFDTLVDCTNLGWQLALQVSHIALLNVNRLLTFVDEVDDLCWQDGDVHDDLCAILLGCASHIEGATLWVRDDVDISFSQWVPDNFIQLRLINAVEGNQSPAWAIWGFTVLHGHAVDDVAIEISSVSFNNLTRKHDDGELGRNVLLVAFDVALCFVGSFFIHVNSGQIPGHWQANSLGIGEGSFNRGWNLAFQLVADVNGNLLRLDALNFCLENVNGEGDWEGWVALGFTSHGEGAAILVLQGVEGFFAQWVPVNRHFTFLAIGEDEGCSVWSVRMARIIGNGNVVEWLDVVWLDFSFLHGHGQGWLLRSAFHRTANGVNARSVDVEVGTFEVPRDRNIALFTVGVECGDGLRSILQLLVLARFDGEGVAGWQEDNNACSLDLDLELHGHAVLLGLTLDDEGAAVEGVDNIVIDGGGIPDHIVSESALSWNADAGGVRKLLR